MRGLVSDGEPKKKHVYGLLGGLLTVQEAQDLLDQKAVGEQLVQETRQNGGGAGVSYVDSVLLRVRQAWLQHSHVQEGCRNI